ncbi:MAG: ZIP family metal transporter [Candidatus Binataceae bacterium]
MPDPIKTVLPYAAIAVGPGIIAAFVAIRWSLSRRVAAYVQHFTGGVLIAAVATDIMPQLESKAHSALWALVSFAAGGLLMTFVKWMGRRAEAREESRFRVPIGLAVASSVDNIIDGVLIGAGVASGGPTGLILAAAVGLEGLFVTLVTVDEFRTYGASMAATVLMGIGMNVAIGVAAIPSAVFLNLVPITYISDVLAFSAAALIYLAIEEFLVESHKTGQHTIYSTGLLFVGFLTIFAFRLLYH